MMLCAAGALYGRQGVGRGLRRLPVQLSRKAVSSVQSTGGGGGSRAVGLWLAGCSGMVAGAVLLGGVTRLTESGLSMVDWRLLKDMRPPSSEAEWQAEFERYKTFPEFAIVHSDFQLHDFKRIFYMEWAHRMWGRMIGLAYFLPLAYFLSKGHIPRADYRRHAVFSALLLGQGAYGWYMVKSGLQPPEPDPQTGGGTAVPRVSQYRLAGHLGLAFLLYSGMFWTSMSLLKSDVQLTPGGRPAVRFLPQLRALTHLSKLLAFTTAMSGAFVAGLDAGLIYNSFPKMAGHWVPPEAFQLSPRWRNLFENPALVQFDHRVLGVTTFSTIAGVWILATFCRLPPRVNRATHALFAVVSLQLSMGVAALVHYVPIWLASAHQCGSLLTLSAALWLSHELKLLKKALRTIRK